MEEANINKCSICNEVISDEVYVIHKKRIKTLISASEIRKDNKCDNWFGKESLNVHRKCNYSYASEHNLVSVAGQSRKSKRSQEFEWNKDNCVLCMKDVSQNFIDKEQKKPPEKRDSVKCLTDKGKDTLITAAKSKEDSNLVTQHSERLNQIFKLKNIDMKYHQSCYEQFTYKKRDQLAQRPLNNDNVNVVKFVSRYIKDNSDEC